MGDGGSFGCVDGLIEDTICCPQIAVATPMGFEILTGFDNVSVEPYPWLCIVCVCGGVIVCVCVHACVCVHVCVHSNIVLTFQLPLHTFLLPSPCSLRALCQLPWK